MLGFVRTLGEVIAAAPTWMLAAAVGAVIAAWILRRIRREGFVAGRVALIFAAVVLLALAVRAGAERVGQRRRAAGFQRVMEEEARLGRERLATELAAFRASCAPGATDVTANLALCKDLAASLLGNVFCQAECIAVLDTRPDLADER